MQILLRLLLTLGLLTGLAQADRVGGNLESLYTFASPEGTTVRDQAGPHHLTITNPNAVTRTPGQLEIRGNTRLISKSPATRLNNAIKKSSELTLEAWITPADTNQSGPARIVSLSRGSQDRNITLGQEGHKFDVRFRTNRTSNNGLPSLASPNNSVQTKLTHVAYTRDRSGNAIIYLNGKPSAQRKIAGNTLNWFSDFHLVLGNEADDQRLWKGRFHLVAIYSRALSQQDVVQNFKAGPQAQTATPEEQAAARNTHHFETKVAPILANHCLECHDASTRKGKLDLSQRTPALAGGKNGKALVAGNLDHSLLWEEVDSDNMPEDRPPLTPEEKQILKDWISNGAHWSLNTIDPANYLHGARPQGVWVQRLTIPEYIETVRSTLGVDIEPEARQLLPPDLRADGFSNTAYNLNIDFKHVESYDRLAQTIVQKLDVPKFTKRFARNTRFTDKDMGNLISKMGKWVLRGPLDEREIISYRGITTAAAAAGASYEEATAFVLEAMLQSPRFIYRIERQQGDGSHWPITDHELASRLSYIIWGGPPDEQLYQAADEGKLSSKDELRKQTERMLKDPRAITRSLLFASEWLNLGRLQNMRPNPKHFPAWKPQLATDMKAETLAFFQEVVWTQNRPLSDLMNAQFSYLTPELAKHYGLQPRGSGLQKYDLSKESHRGGLLTQGSILTIGGDEASMVTRGLFVMHDLLRGVVNAPPADVDTTPVPSAPGKTQRDAAMERINDKSCGGCHSKFEPLAFGLEQFDGLGSFQQADHFNNKLRQDGEILFPGNAEPNKFDNAAQLMTLLADSERVRESITWKIAQFSLGRPLGAAEAKSMSDIHAEAWKNGGRYSDVITALVTSDLVLTTPTEE